MILEINRDNINFFKYIKDEIELYLGEKKRNIEEVKIRVEYDIKFFDKRIKEYIKDITYMESCMYEYAIDEEGRGTIIEGDSGMIKIKIDNKYYEFRYSEQMLNNNRREIREYEITEEEFNKKN